jgi:hypothetical protein
MDPRSLGRLFPSGLTVTDTTSVHALPLDHAPHPGAFLDQRQMPAATETSASSIIPARANIERFIIHWAMRFNLQVSVRYICTE